MSQFRKKDIKNLSKSAQDQIKRQLKDTLNSPPERQKRAKSGSKRVATTQYGTFDSRGEYGRFLELMEMQAKKQISQLARQVRFPFFIPNKKPSHYTVDFMYNERGKIVVEDYKGFIHQPQAWRRTKQLWEIKYPGIELREVKGGKK